MTSKLIVKNLTKSFDEKHVLTGIDLSVKRGESVVILGGSGSGKSVLIKIIATLISPTSGSVQVDGEEVSSISAARRDKLMEKFGFLFQGGALFDSLSIWENVAFRLLYHKKMSKKDAREIALQKLKAVGLSEKTADLFPSELSGGMQNRASLARAMPPIQKLFSLTSPQLA